VTGDRDADDLYAALGIPTGATEEDITRAYRRLAREHHPDANPDAPTEHFADLTDAYDVLRDATRRRAYDNTRRARAHAATTAGGVRIPSLGVNHHRMLARARRLGSRCSSTSIKPHSAPPCT
jgi:curved DNA-binding protein CbpA